MIDPCMMNIVFNFYESKSALSSNYYYDFYLYILFIYKHLIENRKS